MRDRLRRPSGYLLLAIVAYVPVLMSSPGRVAADTKQYLYLDPARLLSRSWSMWDPGIGLGTVTHQNIGYLFPLGPFYWLFETLGTPDWVAQRLWLGSILFAAGLGILYLFRTLGLRGTGAVLGAMLYMLSPYSLDYAARISVILLPWAGLGWMLGLVIRGLRTGGWRHAAIFALVIQVIGGVNATALVFVGLAPLLWIGFALLIREVRLGRALATIARFGVLTLFTSAWWIAGLWAQGSYGVNILKYTETLKAVSRTSMPNEVLRGLGYWFFYGRDKLGPWIEASTPYTQRPVVILVSYGIPFLALAGAAFSIWRYRAYFASLIIVGVVIAVGAAPYDNPTPFGGWFKSLANSSTAAFALRSTGRATPLVILGMAGLLAAGVNAAVARVEGRAWARVPLRLVLATFIGLLLLANLPALWNRTFYGANLQRAEDVPQYWHDAAKYLDARPHDTRVMELPGADFASYRWGNTVDPITPGLIDRPYVARELIPYGSPASANLLNAFDLRIQERKLPASALAPMARVLGVGDYVLRNDLQFERYRVLRPEFAQALFTPVPEGLAHAAAFGQPSAAVNSLYPFNDEQALGAVDRVPVPAPVDVFRVIQPQSIVRAGNVDRSVMLSGDGEGLVDLASLGGLVTQPVVLYSGSFDQRGINANVQPGSALIVTDSNRLRARRWSTVTDTVGYTEGRGNHPIAFDESDARLDLFPDAPKTASTTVRLVGARRVGASSYGNPITYTPEDRAALAFDGDPLTAWRTGAFSDVAGDRILVEANRPLTTDHVNLVQVMRPPRGRWITRAVLRFDGGHPTTIELDQRSRRDRGQTIRFGKRQFATLTIEILDTNLGPLRNYGGIDPVGFGEIRLRDEASSRPLRIKEVTVLPTDLVDAVGAMSQSHPLAYVMTRERVIPVPPRRDPELSMTRSITVPTARSFGVGIEERLSTWAPDDVIDQQLGYRGPVRVTSSSHLAGNARARGSAAVDGDPATAWVTPFEHVVGQSITVKLPERRSLDRLDLKVVADGQHSVPTQLIVRNEAGESRRVQVPAVADATSAGAVASVPVAFPAIDGTRFRFQIARVRAVRTHEWYCECDQLTPAAIAELGIGGLPPVTVPARLPANCRDDLVTIDGTSVRSRIVGTTESALRLEPLRVETCGNRARPTVDLAPGNHVVGTARGDRIGWNADQVVLASDDGGRPRPLGSGAAVLLSSAPQRSAPTVRVTSTGHANLRGVASGATRPFWLVLGQSVNAGWRATVDGKDLGESTLVDGYANGWKVRPHGAGPLLIELDWTPQRTVNLALAISAAGVLACVGILLVAGVRIRRRRADARLLEADPTAGETSAEMPGEASAETGLAPLDPLFRWPWTSRPDARGARPVGTALAMLGAGALAAVIAAPAVGLFTAIAVLAAAVWHPARTALRLAPAVAVGICGAFIAAKQIYARFPATFEWPTFFPEIRTLGWLTVALLAADVLLDVAERERVPPPAKALK